MENKINIAELLKDCPKGMELDCVSYDNVSFDKISDDKKAIYPILCYITDKEGNRSGISFTENGCESRRYGAKCVIFPKGKTTWEGFQRPFKDGDILIHSDCTFIYNGFENDMNYGTYVIIDCYGAFAVNIPTKKYGTRFATKEEKEKLFKAIKDNGYKWNAETKTLEKLVEPKFKVGDRVKHISAYVSGIIVKVTDKGYHIDYPKGEGVCYVNFELEKNYELVPNKFDISTLEPFESKVLIRNDENQRWLPAFWGYKVVDGFITTFGWCKYCIPYEGNEFLFKTNNDCDDYFKTWEK